MLRGQAPRIDSTSVTVNFPVEGSALKHVMLSLPRFDDHTNLALGWIRISAAELKVSFAFTSSDKDGVVVHFFAFPVPLS